MTDMNEAENTNRQDESSLDELRQCLNGTGYSAGDYSAGSPVSFGAWHIVKRSALYVGIGASVLGAGSFALDHQEDDFRQEQKSYSEGAQFAREVTTMDYERQIVQIKSQYETRLSDASNSIKGLEQNLGLSNSKLGAYASALKDFSSLSLDGDMAGILTAHRNLAEDEVLSGSLSAGDYDLLTRTMDMALYSAFSHSRINLDSKSNAPKREISEIRSDYLGVIDNLNDSELDSSIPIVKLFSDLLKEDLAEHLYTRTTDAFLSAVNDESSIMSSDDLVAMHSSVDEDISGTKFSAAYNSALKTALLAVVLREQNLSLASANSSLKRDSQDLGFMVDSLRQLKGYATIRRNGFPGRSGTYNRWELDDLITDLSLKINSEPTADASAALSVVLNLARDEKELRYFVNFEDTFSAYGVDITNARSVEQIEIAQANLDNAPHELRGNSYGARAIDHLSQLIAVKKPYLIQQRDNNLLRIMSLQELKRELNNSIDENNDELSGFMVKYLWGDARVNRRNIVNARSQISKLDSDIAELAVFFNDDSRPRLGSRMPARLGVKLTDSDESHAFRKYERAVALARSGEISDLELAVELMDDGDSSDRDSALEFDTNIFYHHKSVELKKSLAIAYIKQAGDVLVDENSCESKKSLDEVSQLLNLARLVSPGFVNNEVYQRLMNEHRAENIVHGFLKTSNKESRLAAHTLHYLRHGDFGEFDDDAGEDTAFGMINLLKAKGFTATAKSLELQVPFYQSFVDVSSFYLLYDEIRNRMPGNENPRHTREYFDLLKEDLDKATNSFEMSLRELFWLGNAEWVDTDGDGVLDSLVDDATLSVPEGILEILRNIPLLGSLLDPHRAGERLYADNYLMKILFGTAQLAKGAVWDSIKYAAGADAADPLRNIMGGVGKILSPVGDSLNIVSSVGRAGSSTTRGILKLLEFPFDAALGWNDYAQAGFSHAGNVLQFATQSVWSAVPGGDASRRVHSGVPYLSHLFFGKDQVPTRAPELIVPVNPEVSLRALRRKRTATVLSRVYDTLTVAGMDAALSHLIRHELEEHNNRRNRNNDDVTGDDFGDDGDAFDGGGPNPDPNPNPNPGGVTGGDGFGGGGSAGDAFGGQ